MLKSFAIGLMAVAIVAAVPAPPQNQQPNLDCFSQDVDMVSCFAVKAISTMKRAARSANVQIIDGVSFVRDVPIERTAKALKSETELLAELPRDPSDKTLSIASQIFDSTVTFFKTHSLQLAAPEGGIGRSLEDFFSVLPNRNKNKTKFTPSLMSALGIKVMAAIPIIFGTLALLTLKALVVGKIALIIAGILALQKYFGSSAYASSFFGTKSHLLQPSAWLDNSNQGWSTAPQVSTHQGYYRSLNDRIDAAKVAYGGQQPEITNEAAH